MEATLFYITAAIILAGALGVVLARDIVHMAVYLLLALLGVAAAYVLLHAEFLAAVQLVVYVGGTLTLIIFGVMLTARSTTRTLNVRAGERFLVLGGGALLAFGLIVAVLRQPRQIAPAAAPDASPLALGTSLLGDYVLPFELSSLLLLASMIGAAYLARRRHGEDGE
jgi:NADH-quinone oxidoreductase subunit J